MRPDYTRSLFLRTMTEPCTILRSGVTLATTVCSVTPEPASIQPIPADRLQPEKRWILRLPYLTGAARGDIVSALGNRYAVVELDGPRSYELAVQVYGILVGPAAGDGGMPGAEMASFLHPNATVQVRRHVFDPVTKRTTLQIAGPAFSARVDDISNTLTEQGMGPVFMLKLACSAVIDIRDGDILSSIIPPVGTMPTVAMVQHVATIVVNAGLSYKQALIVEQVQAGGG